MKKQKDLETASSKFTSSLNLLAQLTQKDLKLSDSPRDLLKNLRELNLDDISFDLTSNVDWVYNVPIERLRMLENKLKEFLHDEYSQILEDKQKEDDLSEKKPEEPKSEKPFQYEHVEKNSFDVKNSEKENPPIEERPSNTTKTSENYEIALQIIHELRTRMSNRRDGHISFDSVKQSTLSHQNELIRVNIVNKEIKYSENTIKIPFGAEMSADLAQKYQKDFLIRMNIQQIKIIKDKIIFLKDFLKTLSKKSVEEQILFLEKAVSYSDKSTEFFISNENLKNCDVDQLLKILNSEILSHFCNFEGEYLQTIAISFFFSKCVGLVNILKKDQKVFDKFKYKYQKYWYYLAWIEYV